MFTKARDDDAVGTCLQGYIDADYATLVRVFGRPSRGDGYKVDAEWCIRFDDGTIATVYNYKDGKNYLGRNGMPKTKIRDWHIGGTSKAAVERVHAALSAVDDLDALDALANDRTNDCTTPDACTRMNGAKCTAKLCGWIPPY